MKTREYLVRYLSVYCYAASLCLLLGAMISNTATAVSSRQELLQNPLIVIDAGHGGIDGGATSCTGVLESTFNLEIAQRLEALLHFLGRSTVMTRTSPESVATEGDTIRQQKRSDLRNRVALINRCPRGTLVSIHQNLFSDAKYYGPQVFYASTPGSEELARILQSRLNAALAPESKRVSKPSKGVYLMERVNCRAVLVECGFLSNPREEALLRNKAYQQKLCLALCTGLLQPGEALQS